MTEISKRSLLLSKSSLHHHAPIKACRVAVYVNLFFPSVFCSGQWTASHFGHITALSLRLKPWYPLNRRVGGPKNWSGCFGEEKTFSALAKNGMVAPPAIILIMHSGLCTLF